MRYHKISDMPTIFALCVLLFFAYGDSVFAASGRVSFSMANWMRMDANDSPQRLLPMTVMDEEGGNITAEKGIGIILPKDIGILWDKINSVDVNGSQTSVSYNPDLKTIIIPVLKTFSSGEQAIISGLTVRIYGTGCSYQNFQLDYNGDSVADITGVNGFQIDTANSRSDNTPPFTITALTRKVGTSSVTLSWEDPPDPDFLGVLISRTLTRAGSITQQEIFAGKSIKTYADDKLNAGDVIQYSLKAKDDIGNLSEAENVSVEIIKETTETPIAITPQPSDTTTNQTNEEVIAPPPQHTASVLDTVTDLDVNDIVSTYTNVNVDTPHLKELVYFYKLGLIKHTKKKLILNKPLTYSQFAIMVGKAFKLKSKHSFLKQFKKLKYISNAAKGTRKISKNKAFLSLLKIKGLKSSGQTIVIKPKKLKGYAMPVDIAEWIVKILDLEN